MNPASHPAITDISDRLINLREQLPDIEWVTAPLQVKRLSRDFNWFSPILKDRFAECFADLIVLPKTEAQLQQVVAACARLQIPVTIRGGGTGNYGQAVPMHGGLVIDMSSYSQLMWAKGGIARAQAGIRLASLEDELRPLGWELRCMPSTYRVATLGGLFAGGFGGIGSVNFGPLASLGTLLGVRVMTLEAEPQIIELRAEQMMDLAHAYGTNGIVLELEIALTPAQNWDEYLLAFPDAEKAFDFAEALAHAPALVKRNVALYDSRIAEYFTSLAGHLRPCEHFVISPIAEQSAEALDQLLKTYNGRIAFFQSAQTARSGHTLLEYCWNHCTLHALKVDKSLTYLQCSYAPGQERAQLGCMQEAAGAELLSHVEFIRAPSGKIVCSGLPIVRYSSAQRLEELILLHQGQGIKINNPHVYTLEDGKHAGNVNPRMLALKDLYDPHHLLNPGKVRSILQ